MNKIYIFGHKNPDTDSVTSSIALSYLYNALGQNTEPRILSSINEETKYVLRKFKISTPLMLNDVKLQVSDINYHKDFIINNKESVYNAFFKMINNNMSTIPIVDDNNKFMGVFAMKDIAKKEILGDLKEIKTNYKHILNTIDGKKILKYTEEIEGNITNIDLKNSDSNLDNKTILIVGNNRSIIEDAINKKAKLIIVTGSNKIKDELLELAKNNKINIICTNKDSFEILSKLEFANYIENYSYQKDIICVNESLDIDDLNDVINKTKHSYYPVIDSQNHCLGLIKLSDLNDKNPKKVILVDHNEISQSVDGLDEAEIIGIVDHHKLGNIGTNKPINFRNMPVGSSCTIVYELFKENKIKVPEDIAALLISGIISDTLLLKSPTTTKTDEKALNDLVKITGIDASRLAMGMFRANDVSNSKSIKEIVYMDFKTFEINKKIVGIGNITTLNSKAILKQKASYIRFLNKECENNKYDILLFVVTDIFKSGSYVLFNQKAKQIMEYAFKEGIEEGDFLPGIISRKKQVLPALINWL